MSSQKLNVTLWKCISLLQVERNRFSFYIYWLFTFSGEPNNSMGSENCLAMFGDDPDQEYYEPGTWNDEDCSKELSFICQCPVGERSSPNSTIGDGFS